MKIQVSSRGPAVAALLVFAGCQASALPALAQASFDCGKARAPIEKAICSDPQLARLDGEIATFYREALMRVGAHPAGRTVLVEQQKIFIADRNRGFEGKYDIAAHMRRQRDNLRRIAMEDGRDGFLGEWASARGSVTIRRGSNGGLTVEANAAEQVSARWVCQWGEENIGAPARADGEALVSGNPGKEWSLRLLREGPMLVLMENAPAGHNGGQPDHCGRNGTLAGAYFPLAAEQPSRAATAPVRPQPPRPESSPVSIAPPAEPLQQALFRRLPVEAFDNTTEGLSEDEKKDLVARGESAEWRITRPGPGRFVVVARRPSSEVSLTVRYHEGRRYLEVFTRNERAQSWSYWETPEGNALLRQAYPPAVFRAANETGDGKPMLASALPADIISHVNNMEACRHWGGEAGENDPPERRRQIMAAIRKHGCEKIETSTAQIRRKYAAQPPLAQVLERAQKMLGD